MIKKRETYAADLGVLYAEYIVGDSKGFGRLIFQLNGQEDIISFNVAQVFTVDEPFDEVYLWN